MKKIRYLKIFVLTLCFSMLYPLFFLRCEAGAYSYEVTEALRAPSCTEGGEMIARLGVAWYRGYSVKSVKCSDGEVKIEQ